MSSLVVVSPPAAEPLNLQTEVKPHLRVTIGNDDGIIKIYQQAARELAEGETGLSFVNKGYRQSHDRFPHRHDWTDRGTGYWYAARRYSRQHWDERQAIKLLRSPLLEVDKIDYIDVNGDLQTLLPAPSLWQAETEYSVGDEVQDSNGNLQQITAANDAEANEDDTFSSGSANPTWNATLNGTTTDGPFTWTCMQVPAYAGDFLVDSDSEPPRILPLFEQIWPLTLRVPNAVQIYFHAGFGTDESALPATAKVLMLQMIGNWYENRESVTPEALKTIPNHLEDLVWSLRVLDYAPSR
jgi:hypothetical protein